MKVCVLPPWKIPQSGYCIRGTLPIRVHGYSGYPDIFKSTSQEEWKWWNGKELRYVTAQSMREAREQVDKQLREIGCYLL